MHFGAELIGFLGSGFAFQSARPERNVALISVGPDIRIAPVATLGAGFDGEISARAECNAGPATFEIVFRGRMRLKTANLLSRGHCQGLR
ncbi:conserved hypothetical protein [Bosea sp. 62]|nr:conserved hypothetical protein [Bosea sp. 7B]CAD5280337.1 conserved hypothetical protein [Bosea sp. 21B]CAD5281436.1 conserved hypothetical protein [Bosea sp. 46]VVT59441.1 conserved hypothetical protein [Bosea sp. EC-HK365B]VXB29040.1 conserved hypothetical protein [Bosea sp. 62]VXB91507.1 conserved hypothetical protein [Bosea sp. 127]VXC37130.1 conserved hypothetical protein [Bosea sp. 29B]VXC81813.1 conserved hypothetical protein [Bosea sp. 125]